MRGGSWSGRRWVTGSLVIAQVFVVACGGAIGGDSDDSGLGGGGGSGGAETDGGSGSGGTGGAAVGVGGGSSGGAGGGSGGDAVGGGGGTPEECQVEAAPGVAVRFDYDEAASADGTDTSFFSFPWPELTRPISDVLGFPNPLAAGGCAPPAGSGVSALVSAAIEPFDYRQYVAELSALRLTTASRHPVIYLAFSDEINQASLPSPSTSLAPNADVFLIDIDSGSPEVGQRIPIRTRVYRTSHYLPDNTLAVVPEPGFPLRDGTLYALVVRRSLGDAAGDPLGSPVAFEAKKLGFDCPGADADYGAAFNVVEAELGLDRREVAAMTVWRAGSPTQPFSEYLPLVEALSTGTFADLTPAGPADDIGGGVHVLEGTLEMLIQQSGMPPYLPAISVSLAGVSVTLSATSEDGAFLNDAPQNPGPGSPDEPRTEPVDFVLTLPDSVLSGATIDNVPLVVYGPGTGGSRYSAVDEGVAADLAGLGIATVSITPVMHDERAHAENISPSLLSQLALADSVGGTTYQAQLIETVESGQLFFNPLNLEAARGNSLQAGVDFVWLARVFSTLALEANVGGVDRTIHFDPARLQFFGHSQGASTGGLLAASTDFAGGVLSGVTGYLPSALLHKTKPADQLGIDTMLDYIVCDDASEPLDETHPFLALLGHFLEPADAELYIETFVQSPTNKDLFIIAGRDDAYAPPVANHAVTTAAGLQEITAPVGTSPNVVAGQALLDLVHPERGYGTTYPSLSANLDYDTTGAFRQYHGAGCADDHFVYLCNADAHADWLAFFESSLTSSPEVP